jgi:hypothetical protein
MVSNRDEFHVSRTTVRYHYDHLQELQVKSNYTFTYRNCKKKKKKKSPENCFYVLFNDKQDGRV